MQKLFKGGKNKSVLSLLLSMLMIFSMSTSFVFAKEASNATPTVTESTTKPSLDATEKATKNTVDIVMFNDFHGNLAEDIREKGQNIGMAKMVGYVNEAKAKNPNTIIVAAGDNYQGTAMSNLTYGEPVSAMMKGMDVVASAVGNHEFDWGVGQMEKWAKDGGFDFLAANITDSKTGKPVAWAKPYIIVEKGGIKVAFIGLAHPDTVTLTKKENVTGLEFTDPIKIAEEWVKYLKDGKAKEGTPDTIIALTHIDSYQNKETKEITGNAVALAAVEGLDAIITGHSHQKVVGKVNGKPIVQASKYGRAMGVMSIELDENNKVKGISPRVDDVDKVKNDIIPDEKTAKTYVEYDKNLKPILGEIIGKATGEFTHDRSQANVTTLGKWSCEVMQEKTGAQVAIQNGGGLRRTLDTGDITMGDLYEIMPFDNALVTMDVKGSDLKKAIDHGILNPDVTDGQFSGLKIEYDKNAAFEKRITKITLTDGTPVDMDKYYKVVVPDFIQTGGDKYDFSNAKNLVETYIPVRDVLVEAIKEAKVINPQPVDYIKEVEPVAIQPVAKPEVVKPAPAKPVAVAKESYMVKANDVLWKVARTYNLTWKRLADFNQIKNPNLIFPGQKLLIPIN